MSSTVPGIRTICETFSIPSFPSLVLYFTVLSDQDVHGLHHVEHVGHAGHAGLSGSPRTDVGNCWLLYSLTLAVKLGATAFQCRMGDVTVTTINNAVILDHPVPPQPFTPTHTLLSNNNAFALTGSQHPFVLYKEALTY